MIDGKKRRQLGGRGHAVTLRDSPPERKRVLAEALAPVVRAAFEGRDGDDPQVRWPLDVDHRIWETAVEVAPRAMPPRPVEMRGGLDLSRDLLDRLIKAIPQPLGLLRVVGDGRGKLVVGLRVENRARKILGR